MEFGRSSAAFVVVATASVDLAVVLEAKDLTVLSYKDTMLWKVSGGLC